MGTIVRTNLLATNLAVVVRGMLNALDANVASGAARD